MRSVRKIVCLLMTIVLVLLTGCMGEIEYYPVMEAADFTTTTLEDAQDPTLKLSFPADGWTAVSNGEVIALAYDTTTGSEAEVNVVAQSMGKFSGKLNQKYRDNLVKAIEKKPGYLALDLMEVRTLHDSPVIYCEATAAFTEESLDALLEAKTITEEDIAAQGGREVLLNIPPSYQITMYAVIGGRLVIYTGTYYEDTQKQDIIDALTTMIATSEIQ